MTARSRDRAGPTDTMSFFPTLHAGFERLLAGTAGRRVAVVGHARPDGDCIGSQVALCRLLRSRGVESVCVNADPVPRRLRFLVGDTPFLPGREFVPDGERPEGWSAIFTDCADHARVGGRLAAAFPRPLGSVDHHLSNESYAGHNIVDSAAAATAEILAGLFIDGGHAFDAAASQALYVGIATDTGQFRFPSTTPRVFALTGHLIEHGADPAAASAEIYERESFAKLELLGRFLASLHRECGGRVCAGFLKMTDFGETGASSEDTEGLVDYARAIDGVDIGMLVEERPDGMKASLRCKETAYRVDQVAAAFGGGGHACAAGLNTPGSLDELYPRLVAAVAEQLARVDASRRAD